MRCMCGSSSSMGFFANINSAGLIFAKEGHEPEAEHIERGQAGSGQANRPENGATMFPVKGCAKDFILAEKACQRRKAGYREGGNGHHPEGDWDFFAQAAHAAHVLLAADGVDHRPGAKE